MKLRYTSHLPYLFLALCAASLSGCDDGMSPSASLEVAAVGTYGGAFSDDGGYSIVGSINHGGSLWRTQDGERLYNWNHHKGEFTSVLTADFSPDGKWALTADEHTLVLWKTEDGSAHRFWNAPGEVLSIALSEGGRYALLGLSDHTAVIFDVQRGGVRRTFRHNGRVRSVDLSNDSTLAVTGSEDNTAIIWDVEGNKALHTIQHDDYVQMVAISPNGSTVLSAAKYDKAILTNATTGEQLGDIPLAGEKLRRGVRFTAAKFSDDGRYLLTGLPDRVVQLWDTTSLQELSRWSLPKRDAWKPTGAAVVAVSFGQAPEQYFAMASNGYIHQLSQTQ
ncbi:WD40 repeat domain-containing protein [Aurantivibrio plasticivorans]